MVKKLTVKEPNKIYFGHCMLYEFLKGTSATDAVKNLENVFGRDILKYQMVAGDFSKFASGHTLLEDSVHENRIRSVYDENLTAVIKRNKSFTIRKVAERVS